MGDYVNRERVLDEYRMLEKLTGDSSTVGQAEERLMQSVIRIIYELPSAFDGMTNGEVMQALFPYVEIVGGDETFIAIRIDSKKGVGTPIALYAKWWNAPYKKEGD